MSKGPRSYLHRQVETVVPTDIIEMQCNVCNKLYTRNGTGLRIRRGEFLPCIGLPINSMRAIMSDAEECGSTDYTVRREMQIMAMPIGKVNNDLSRKHS